ncbi:septation protein SepH [Marinactinospora thermotolerans]|uniref:DUF3071 domain-containing protein n=1 Tax=Marinactinospora thermotolerans DSM 45154 TaxID=1122192 RepID=A0A1T4S555_9ACTN|nr:septation protein SepH [Marinactinospora thermotolerans]SKA23419.1 Protein of unknown function [Marinactinospora thermotolerans DSM 45154]
MQELRLVAVSEDGTYLVLASAGRGTRFTLPVDDRLRAAVRGQFSRLGQYEIEVENPLRPKEIQARIRAGETAEAIAEAAGIPIERVRWFEGPVLQEREYMAQQAQRATVRRQGDAAPGPVLGDIVAERVGQHQIETGDATWDSWKREDGAWQVQLSFLSDGEARLAHWIYEPRRRCVTPADDEAARFSSPVPEEPLDLGPGSANVTPFVPRRQPTREAPAATGEPSSPPADLEGEAAPPAPAASSSGRVSITPELVRPVSPVADSAPASRPAATDPSDPAAPAARTEQPARHPAPSPEEETSLPAAAAGGGGAQAARRKGRGRRASVPSWDEIMFGAKKPE